LKSFNLKKIAIITTVSISVVCLWILSRQSKNLDSGVVFSPETSVEFLKVGGAEEFLGASIDQLRIHIPFLINGETFRKLSYRGKFQSDQHYYRDTYYPDLKGQLAHYWLDENEDDVGYCFVSINGRIVYVGLIKG